MIKTNLCPLHLCNSHITIRPSVLELQGILNGENVKKKITAERMEHKEGQLHPLLGNGAGLGAWVF